MMCIKYLLYFQDLRLKRMGDDREKKSQVGRKYFDELDTYFWKLPGKYMSISYNIYIFYFNILYFLADIHDHESKELS